MQIWSGKGLWWCLSIPYVLYRKWMQWLCGRVTKEACGYGVDYKNLCWLYGCLLRGLWSNSLLLEVHSFENDIIVL